jgi:pimeloyl-ACP methyl ester carboxylesterase
MFSRRASWLALSLALLSLAPACSGAPGGDSDPVESDQSALMKQDVTFDVTVRATGKVTLHASVYVNERSRSQTNVLAVHGLSETGFTFEPLAHAIFADRRVGRGVRHVVAIDLPGHGDSTYPSGLPSGVHFGDLLIEDNVDVLLQALDALRAKRLAPQIIVGHSMGGLEVQAAQQALLSKGSSLAAHGIHAAVLLAPVPPHGRPWTPASGDVTPFIVNDPTLGSYLQLTPEAFVAQAFSTTSGQIATDAPTPEEVTAGRYVGPEPLVTLLQLVESPIPQPDETTVTIPRPTVDAGAFDIRRGTLLTIASFSQDVLVPPADLEQLYTYLTGDQRELFYRPVSADDAVHATYISNPGIVVDALRPLL